MGKVYPRLNQRLATIDFFPLTKTRYERVYTSTYLLPQGNFFFNLHGSSIIFVKIFFVNPHITLFVQNKYSVTLKISDFQINKIPLITFHFH